MKKIETLIISSTIIIIIILGLAIMILKNSIKELQKTTSYNSTAIRNEIDLNANNRVTNQLISDREMCNLYFNNYKNLLLNSPKQAYDLLEPEYKVKRFPHYEQFEKYVKEKEDHLNSSTLKEYFRKNYDDYDLYTIKDTFDVIYVFKETAVQEYTVQLDDYTLENDTFTETYKKASIMDKCLLNCEKIMQMINTQDYEAVYNLLNSNFKNSNFPTLKDFEKYIRDNFPKYCRATYIEYRKPLDNVYIIKTRAGDITGEDKKNAEFNIVMMLKEGTDFEISFEIN